jgi:CheY-like chemotaxis protein
MLPGQKKPLSKSVPPELEIREMPESPFAVKKTAASYASAATDAKSVAQFRFRILVVDDEPSIRETARQILESESYEVLTAADGLDGLHALSKSLPDLIVSDLNMPRMSGFEFLGIVRKRFPHIATIAVSGEYIQAGKNDRSPAPSRQQLRCASLLSKWKARLHTGIHFLGRFSCFPAEFA